MAKKSKGKRRIFHWFCQAQRARRVRGKKGEETTVTKACNHASKTNGDHNVANHPVADFPLMLRFCPVCRAHTEHKLKEPKSGAAGLAKAKNKK